ncbi:hypothetical protein [Mucilaginibacter sp.]
MNDKIISAQQSRDILEELSESFKPTDVKFLLALNSEFSIDECIGDAQAMISRLQKFVDGGHVNQGEGYHYSDVSGF